MAFILLALYCIFTARTRAALRATRHARAPDAVTPQPHPPQFMALMLPLWGPFARMLREAPVVIPDHLLVKRIADSVDQPAFDLALDQHHPHPRGRFRHRSVPLVSAHSNCPMVSRSLRWSKVCFVR